jgi:xanthine dehydrogenase accessory factor
MRELLTKLTEAMDAGKGCVYCSVVETRGSTPQKAGAAMVVFADGSQAGTLGGGCVEAEVKRQALRTLSDGDVASQLFTFNLDDNYGWDDGLICGGRMTIVAAPLAGRAEPRKGPGYEAHFARFRELVESGAGCTEAVVVNAEQAGTSVGSRYLFDAAGNLLENLATSQTNSNVRRGLKSLSERPRAWLAHGVAYLPVLPRITLFIVGGGHVGQAVGKLASDVDFDIWVLDDRATYASPERFPTALRRLVGDIGAELQQVRGELGPSHYVLIVTRGHAHDEEALYHLATTSAGYVGMIGSKRKIRMIFEDLLARGIPKEALDKVHAPLGLPIGSQTVPEIAVSIVAELIACRNGGARGGGCCPS